MQEWTREQAWALLNEYNQDAALIRHALAVEGVMRHYARKMGEDEEKWGIVGLLHDLDYEKFPEQHCAMTQKIMRERGVPEEIIHACISHGYGICIDVEPVLPMENVLYTIDELTGLISAAAIMRPSRSVMDLELKSVKKKFKTPSFAAGVNRDVIRQGAERMGADLDAVIQEVIEGMREVADAIGLAGA